MKQFDLKYQWELYLDRVGLKEETMPPIQIQETKRAFYGASGQMLMLLKDELSKLEDDKACVVLQDLMNQVGDFWLAQTNKQD